MRRTPVNLPLSEAIAEATQLLQEEATAPSGKVRTALTRRQIAAIERLLADATITLNQISAGVIRREGRHG